MSGDAGIEGEFFMFAFTLKAIYKDYAQPCNVELLVKPADLARTVRRPRSKIQHFPKSFHCRHL